MVLEVLRSELLALKKKVNDFFGDAATVQSKIDAKLSLTARRDAIDKPFDVLEGTYCLGDVSENDDQRDGIKIPKRKGVLKVGATSAIQIYGVPNSEFDVISYRVAGRMLEPIREQLTNALRYAKGPISAHFFDMTNGKTTFDVSPSSKVCGHPESDEHFMPVLNSVSIKKPGIYQVELHVVSSTMTPSQSANTQLSFIYGAKSQLIDRLPSATTDVRLKGLVAVTDGIDSSVQWDIGGVAANVSVSLTVQRLGE